MNVRSVASHIHYYTLEGSRLIEAKRKGTHLSVSPKLPSIFIAWDRIRLIQAAKPVSVSLYG